MYGCWKFAFISYTGKRWYGGGADACDRDTASIDELRWIEHLVDLPDVGSREQRSRTKICELKAFLNQ